MKTKEPKLQKLISIIEEQIDQENISVSIICDELCLSRSHLHRILKKHTGLSLNLFIRHIKLERACELLADNNIRVNEIAFAVGISSPQNFSKYFGQIYGISPSKFRKNLSQDITDTYRLAVLPFVNLSCNPEQEYFSDGITEELITVLSQLSSVRVVGRSSSFSFKGRNSDLRAIGEALQVDYILDGSVRRSNQQIRIAAQLIKVSDGLDVWSQKYDCDLKDIFEIQDEISNAIQEEIEIKLLGKEATKTPKRNQPEPAAFEHYLTGKYHYNKFGGLNDFVKSIESYKKAIAIDPDYAAAYAGLASSYLSLWFYRMAKHDTVLHEIRFATTLAIEKDAQSPESLLALARQQMLIEWDFKAAEKSFMKALKYGNELPDVHGQYALLCSFKQQEKLALKHLNISLNLDPHSLFNNFYGAYVHWIFQNQSEALRIGQKLVELEPTFWGGHAVTGLNLMVFHHKQEALIELKKAINKNYCGFTLSAFAATLGISGQSGQALKILQEMETLNTTQQVSNYDFGVVHASLGDAESAFSYFKKAIENHEPSMLFFKYILRDWFSDTLYTKRFEDLLVRIP